MSTLSNRPNTAVLVVDVQVGVVERAHERDAVVANIGKLVEKARRETIPVIWVQHSDEQIVRSSDVWRIVPELTPDAAEPLIEKLAKVPVEKDELLWLVTAKPANVLLMAMLCAEESWFHTTLAGLEMFWVL